MNPLSAIYGAVTGVRNRLYDSGVFKVRKLSAPVISVGSISAGGAGKTPFTIMLGELLKLRGVTFDVLSRGYGRKTRGVRIVDPRGSASEHGDEPLLIARRLGCPVIVGESRHEAGTLAEESFHSQLHILDDGFQHRRLHRDYDIVMLTPEDARDRLLPTGRLREPLESLRRADVVVLTGEIDASTLPEGIKNLWHVRRSMILRDPPPNPVVFCGIARPRNFLAQLKAHGTSPAAFRAFRDHHAYSAEDVRQLLALRDQNHADGFLATEKDVMNLGPLLADMGKVSVAQVHMELTGPADALDTMLATIAERQRKA